MYREDRFLLLFLLYTNDLPAVSKLCMQLSFAYDKNLFTTKYDVNSLVEEATRELVNMYAWFQINKLYWNS